MSQIPPFDPDLEGPEPKYVRLADHIQARIAAGELGPNTRLRSERDLSREYGVAYGTIRSTARVLRDRGLIVTSPGKGTYIVGPKPTGATPSDEGER